MRRLHALLVSAGLMAAPVSAVAGPSPKSDQPSQDTFEWSMSTSRARLGIAVIGLTPELRTHFGAPAKKGVMVGRVEAKSAAAAAGLAVGDIVTDVKGRAVDSADDVLDALATTKKDDSVTLSVIRDRKPITLTAKMLNDPGPSPSSVAPPAFWSERFREWFRAFPDWDRPSSSDKT